MQLRVRNHATARVPDIGGAQSASHELPLFSASEPGLPARVRRFCFVLDADAVSYAGSQKILLIQSGTNYYLHNDHLSLRVRTDNSGNIVDQRGHFPFGESWELR
ncbi:MAG TPA: hypothetical protein VIW67_06145 [Terriglobales bacterium]